MKTHQIPVLTLAAIALISSAFTAAATTTIVYESFGDTGPGLPGGRFLRAVPRGLC